MEQVVEQWANKHFGYLRTSDCEKLGISRTQLPKLVKENVLKKIGQGIYCLPDIIEDDLYILHLRYSELVFSHETALYYLGYSDQVPFYYTACVPKGFNSSILRDNCRVVQSKREIHDKGVVIVKTEFGNPIFVYCIEKTLCDLLHRPSELDKERFIPAIKKYLESKDRNNIELLEFAKDIGVEKQMRMYMEMFL